MLQARPESTAASPNRTAPNRTEPQPESKSEPKGDQREDARLSRARRLICLAAHLLCRVRVRVRVCEAAIST